MSTKNNNNKKSTWHNLKSEPIYYRRSKKRKNRKNKSLPTRLGGKKSFRRSKNINRKGIKQLIKDVEEVPKDFVSLSEQNLSTGINTIKDIGKFGSKISKSSLEEVKKKSKKKFKYLTTKKKKGKKSKSSYRVFLSKELKKVKKAHPNWPQSKVFKEAVKGWKNSK